MHDLYERLTADCWINLATYFKKDDQGHFCIETSYCAATENKFEGLFGNSVQSIVSPLEKCIMNANGCLIDLNPRSFNKQGLAIKKSTYQGYQRGKHIHFYSPIDDAVARFYADSVRADLDCYGVPQYSVASLGVLVCTEGAPKN